MLILAKFSVRTKADFPCKILLIRNFMHSQKEALDLSSDAILL